MADTFNIGTISAKRGTKEHGDYPVIRTPEGKTIGIPLTVINGAKDGPKLYVSGGGHGDEFEGPLAIITVLKELNPLEVRGTLIGAPIHNIPSFLAKTSQDTSSMRENPLDWKNLHRVFPGKKDGTITERLAYNIGYEILPKVDFAMDLHSGGDRGTSLDLAGFYDVEGDYGRRSFEMANQFPFETLWRLPTDKTHPGRLPDVAYQQNVPIVVSESHGEGRCRWEDVQKLIYAIKNVMKYLGMLDGVPEGNLEKKRMIDPENYIPCTVGGGILKPFKLEGDTIEMGEVIGEVIDIRGNVVEEIKSPFSGIITGVRTKPVVWPGEVTFLIAKLRNKGDFWPQ